jgi:hypothetical protein
LISYGYQLLATNELLGKIVNEYTAKQIKRLINQREGMKVATEAYKKKEKTRSNSIFKLNYI